MSIDLIEKFGVDSIPPLKKFYMDRLIPDIKIADWLGISSMTVGRWLRSSVPDNYKPKMDELQQEILAWEKQNNRMFNSMLVDNMICPYDSDGVRFGLHFNFYHECEKECNIFDKCELWSIAHPAEYLQSRIDNNMIQS